jgi:sugar (pentulose or hexulose) kinase
MVAYLLSADIGTSSLKAVLFTPDLRVVAQSKREYVTEYPAFRSAEQNPDDWTRAFAQAVREILDATAISPTTIAAIAIDGMSSLALPVDGTGRALRPAMIWLDRRAQEESERIRRAHETLQISINGNRSDPSNFAPKVMWLRDHEPEIYKAAACFLHCNAVLIQRLTGRFTMDVSQAGLSQICDIRSGRYSTVLIEACGIDQRKLPEIASCTEVVGTVTPEAAAMTGLAAGTPVIAGAMDNVAATVGLKLQSDGDAYISAGTVTNVGLLLDQPVFDGKGLLYHYGIDGKWLINGGVDYGGAGLRWFRDILGDCDFATLDRLASETRCGEQALLFLPYMTGQRAPLWNENASGVIFGLTPDTDRRHLARMFMESAALGARHVFGQLCSRQPTRAALTGGITGSDLWTQIFADVTGIRLRKHAQGDVATLGGAILAGIGVGLFSDAADAFRRIPDDREVLPSSGRDYYDDLFAVFVNAYCNVLGSLNDLTELRKTHEAGQ